jgi:two-component system OmpR family response regulator
MRVLIADDDPICREIVHHLLAHAGHAVTAVADGEAARSALIAQPFDIALLDLQMPRLSGAEVAQGVRAALPAHGLPRLVALSAAVDPGAERRLLALGFDACLGKPIRPSTLLTDLGLQPAPARASDAGSAVL